MKLKPFVIKDTAKPTISSCFGAGLICSVDENGFVSPQVDNPGLKPYFRLIVNFPDKDPEEYFSANIQRQIITDLTGWWPVLTTNGGLASGKTRICTPQEAAADEFNTLNTADRCLIANFLHSQFELAGSHAEAGNRS